MDFVELLHVVGLLGSWPYDRQVVAKHVPHLRQLVHVEEPQHATNLAKTWIVLSRPARGATTRGHRAELVDRELDATLPDPRLAVKERPTIAEQVGHGDNGHRQSKREHPDSGNREVEEPLASRVGRSVDLVDVEQ